MACGARIGVQGAHGSLWAWGGESCPSSSLEGGRSWPGAWVGPESSCWGHMPGLPGTRQHLALGKELTEVEAGTGMRVEVKRGRDNPLHQRCLLLAFSFTSPVFPILLSFIFSPRLTLSFCFLRFYLLFSSFHSFSCLSHSLSF